MSLNTEGYPAILLYYSLLPIHPKLLPISSLAYNQGVLHSISPTLLDNKDVHLYTLFANNTNLPTKPSQLLSPLLLAYFPQLQAYMPLLPPPYLYDSNKYYLLQYKSDLYSPYCLNSSPYVSTSSHSSPMPHHYTATSSIEH